MAINVCATSSLAIERSAKGASPKPPPLMTPVKISVKSDKPYPLYCPMPSKAPAMAALGSSVSKPSGVSAQSSGMDLPSRSCQRIMPLPAVVKAISSATGKSPPLGAARPQGLVPTRGEVPPQGAISAPALVMAMPMQSASRARRA